MLTNPDLILNASGRIFHLDLSPDQVADTVILVGDPGRVPMVSSFFDSIEVKVSNREFITHTGFISGKRISVVSSGIGCDNMDIVLNELDILKNRDLQTGEPAAGFTRLTLIRIGTSGGIQPEIEPGSFVLTHTAAGFDNLLHFYAGMETVCDMELSEAFRNSAGWCEQLPDPYFVRTTGEIHDALNHDVLSGITYSAPGFYGPQARRISLELTDEEMLQKITGFEYQGQLFVNFEMESSALYGLAALMGHQAAAICIIVANRASRKQVVEYEPFMEQLVNFCLDRIVSFKPQK